MHVKVSFKKDNTGLGHKTHKKAAKADDGLAEFAQGLDVFQRILGRLNGKDENRVDAALGSRRLNMVMEMGKFGMAFVYGGLLEGTVDKMLVEDKVSKGKRKLEEAAESSSSSSESSEEEEPVKKKSRSDKKEKKDKKKEKSDKKDKKEKKEKKDKKEKKSKSDKKEKKSKSDKKDKKSSKTDTSIEVDESKPKAQPVLRGMQGTRARWIAQKRAATMDAKSLAEILMVTS